MGGHVIIVGASLAGLMAALASARAGQQVTLIERSADTGRTGAALRPGDGLLQLLTGRRTPSTIDGHRAQTWTAVHALLRAAVEAEPSITIHDGIAIAAIGQDESAAWAVAEDGRTFAGDVLVGADGYRSVVRGAVSPDHPDADFAGYVIWIGIAHETDLARATPWPTGHLYEEAKGYIMLGTELPGEDGSVRPGDRRISWAMYDRSRNALLRERGAVVGKLVQRTLLPGDLPDDLFATFARESRLWPEPWRSAIRDCVQRRAVIGTPIAEYLPPRLANGRLCLVGDAAHVPTPMTGNGFVASRDDAVALGRALEAFDASAKALHSYEDARLPAARRLVASGQQFSRGYAALGEVKG